MSPFIKPLVIINYYVYRFYQRWEGNPIGWTVRLIMLFFMVNSIMLLKLLGGVSFLAPNGNYYALSLPLMALFALINYLLVFKSNKHFEYFSEIKNTSSAGPIVFFWLYFAATIIPLIFMLVNFLTGRH